MADPVDDRVDVFISHSGDDWKTADWVEWVLRKQLNLSTIYDRYDFKVGDNFILKMNDALERAKHVALLLSPSAVDRRYVAAEWSAAYKRNPDKLIIVIVAKVEVPALLDPIIHIDLVGLTRDQKIEALQSAFLPRQRPISEPPLPEEVTVEPAPPPVVPTAPKATIQTVRAASVWIPPGLVKLGIDADEEAFLADRVSPADLLYQGPSQDVDAAGFYLARFTTTNKEYWRFVEAVGYEIPHGGGSLGASAAWDARTRTYPAGLDDHPVVAVNWFDAVAYCNWLGGRLPTEVEWERAARGPDKRRWPFGDDWRPDAANTYESGRNGTVAVGTLSPLGDGPFGVADQAGNVWEWCSTILRPYPYTPEDGREKAAGEGRRVIRGGDWVSDCWTATVSMRRGDLPSDRGATIGFRVAFDGPPPA